MHVYHDILQLPAFNNAVITVGIFDGVHEGHVQIIKQVVNEALNMNGTPLVITFYPHPRQIIDEQLEPFGILTTPEEKSRLLGDHGIEHLVIVPFDKSFSRMPAQEYINDFLVGIFHPHTIITGYDHRFGVNREGDYHLLAQASTIHNFILKEIPRHVVESVVISSTKIRETLLTGAVETANLFLGYPYTLAGKVIEGKKIGRTLGYPTANIDVTSQDKLIPGNGVYAVKVNSGSFLSQKGMMSIGNNPTFGENQRTLEVHLFDFNRDIYGETLEIQFLKRLRNEEKFDSASDLIKKMEEDMADALRVLN
ncbi:MAG: bifunctional riboflavin kinase/FAD synthetase [Ferruginibacter sp.]